MPRTTTGPDWARAYSRSKRFCSNSSRRDTFSVCAPTVSAVAMQRATINPPDRREWTRNVGGRAKGGELANGGLTKGIGWGTVVGLHSSHGWSHLREIHVRHPCGRPARPPRRTRKEPTKRGIGPKVHCRRRDPLVGCWRKSGPFRRTGRGNSSGGVTGKI